MPPCHFGFGAESVAGLVLAPQLVLEGNDADVPSASLPGVKAPLSEESFVDAAPFGVSCYWCPENWLLGWKTGRYVPVFTPCREDSSGAALTAETEPRVLVRRRVSKTNSPS